MVSAPIPAALMPREKLLTHGPQALADAELLALLLRTGLAGTHVLQLAANILDELGGVAGLLNTSAQDLTHIKGLGPAKRAELCAVMELARRSLGHTLRQAPAFTSPGDVATYLQLHLAHKPHEVFAVLFLDSQHRLIAMEELFRGTLSQTSVYPREVVLRALHHHASAVVLAHNHPSGELKASSADIGLTHTLQQALQLIDVRVLDHLIVSTQGHLSMQNQGLC
jgi:DNA repair protein RadC